MKMDLMNLRDFRQGTLQGSAILAGIALVALATFVAFVATQQAIDTFFIASALVFSVYVVWQSRRTVQRLTESEAKAKQVAGHDILSGLPNRFLFNDLVDSEIGRCARNRSSFALFYLDLDRFKEINDTFGHDAGDQLIISITTRITRVLRQNDRLARLGGDEFGILQTDVKDPRDSAALAQRILDALSVPFDLGERQVFAGISIGIALCPQDATDRSGLMCLADLALYRAKHEGRNRYTFFEARMGEHLRLRKAIEDELRQAIANDGLGVEYQPVMSGDGQTMVGLEALVRWNHPTQGNLPPESFISLAEERGLIVPLGEWVLRRACLDARRWPELRVAVNVSPIQFRHKEFVSSVVKILQETGMEPQRLELELTEGVVIEDADQAENSIIELRALGIRMVLDDFGTGYSSLIYLRRFAFDKIKIDRSFLQYMEPSGESAIIVQSIVQLGRALGLTVNAEGIETPDQVEFLRALGCDELQGFLFSASLAADDVAAFAATAAGGYGLVPNMPLAVARAG
ncbi:putative bifunctional diguanylate cyclase/phosphodiesterase [Methyloferula stellata]|uniref:putative bifunctional diguanylate cyclase/phosphodiesterase n=1 Tax=Methyloferula stellata TaxID=876270 RepID=UPI00035D3F72|nr:EAL domain-containing protein [Methyloferula stellata]